MSLHPEKSDSTLVAIDYAKITEIETKDPAFNAYLTSRVSPQHQTYTTGEKVLTLISEQALQEQIDRLIQLRNRKAISYLTSQGIPAANLRVETLKAETLNNYTSKNQYKINLVLAGDEQPTEEQ